jgi:ferric-dicitrate binding protein FerR (iron transport regulator)
MMKRAVWFALGAAAGAGGSAYARRKARAAAARYAPGNLARGAVDRVSDALREGRAAMATKEAELRAVAVVEPSSVELGPARVSPRYGPRRRSRR